MALKLHLQKFLVFYNDKTLIFGKHFHKNVEESIF